MIRTDVAVIGLGAMGAATLFQLSRRGVSAVGVDRFEPPHAMGSSHGETRITREAVGEGDEYVPLVRRSHEIWRQIEAQTGERLFERCGFLMMAPRGGRTGHHGKTDFLNRTVQAARRHAIGHELLDTAAIAARFPAFVLDGAVDGYYEKASGFVRPERCIAAQLRLALAMGARTLTGCTVVACRGSADGVHVETDGEPILAERVVLSAGPWAGRLLGPPFEPALVPRRQVLHWFAVADEAPFQPGRCPSYVWMHGSRPEDYFYGFPALPGSGQVKVATEQYEQRCDPDTVSRDVPAEEHASMYAAHIAGRLRGVTAAGRAAVCLYTVTPDSGFVIDRHPTDPRIVVVSPCSGHGFKHSAAVGEAVAELVSEGRSSIDLSPFRLDRRRA